MLFKSLIVLAAGLMFLGSNLYAQELRVPLTSKSPVIDGIIGSAEWQSSIGFDGFITYGDGTLNRRRVRCNVTADESNIYLAIQSQLPDSGKLKSDALANSPNVIYDESVELYINPSEDSTDNVCYQFLANSVGRYGYNIHKKGDPKEAINWKGNWKQSSTVHNDWWHFECMSPIASMGMVEKGRKTTDGVWTINLCRNWKYPWEWSSLTGGYANSGIRVSFTKEAAPIASYSSKSDPAILPYEGIFTIKNPSTKPLALKARMVLVKNNMPQVKKERTFTLAAGASESLIINVDQGDPTKLFELSLKLTSADTTVTYYSRWVQWKRGDEAYRWIAEENPKKVPVDFKFAYYPSKNRMKIVADISGLSGKVAATGALVKVRTRLEKTEVKSVVFPIADFKNGLCEKTFDLPSIEGMYEIVATVTGKDVPKEATIKTFERTVYPWENTLTGRSEKVYPPFTPIKVIGQKLSTVLREYSFNDAGLMDQITAQSANTGIVKPILASPMRYTATVDSQSVEVKSGPLAIASAKDNEVVVTGGFKAGPFSATYKNTWDYDGTVKVELTLLPSGGHTINELTLEIPFTNESGAMIHANADRIRAQIAQKIPVGSGVVWDASKVACDDILNNFCPYVYIGTPVRGLCWFAENDKNWGWDRVKPNLDVVRKDGNVILRIHLVNQPTKISTAQTITFGMLAAPVKPPLVAPGKDPNWWRYRFDRTWYSVLGTDINWLSQGTCGDVYPVGKDLYFWEMLARGNRGEKLSESEIAAINDRGRKYFAMPRGDITEESWFACVGQINNRVGANMIFYYNRSVYNALEEYKTFHDEWDRDNVRSIVIQTVIFIVPTSGHFFGQKIRTMTMA